MLDPTCQLQKIECLALAICFLCHRVISCRKLMTHQDSRSNLSFYVSGVIRLCTNSTTSYLKKQDERVAYIDGRRA